MHIRILSNICLIALSLNKISECKNFFTQILDLIQKEKNIHGKILLFKEVIYIFFRIESLNNFYEENILNNEIFSKNPSKENFQNENNNNNYINLNTEKFMSKKDKEINELAEEENTRKNISKTLLSLHKFLRDNDIETWIKCLIEESAYFKSIKDVNGYVFTIINQYAANYYQTGKVGDFKNIYPTIINNYGERAKEKNKEKSPEKILIEMKERIELAVDIYRKLVETENELFNQFTNRNETNNINNPLNKNKIILDAINLNERNNKIADSNANNSENITSNNVNNNNQKKIEDDGDINIKHNVKIIHSIKDVENNEYFQEEKNSNKFLIKLFFKHALYKLNKESSHNDLNIDNINNNFNSAKREASEANRQMNNTHSENSSAISSIKSQIELALKLLDNDEFDVSSVNLLTINSEVTKSLRTLFQNIKMIRNKKELQKALKSWKVKALGYDKYIEYMCMRYKDNINYFKGLLDLISKGNYKLILFLPKKKLIYKKIKAMKSQRFTFLQMGK